MNNPLENFKNPFDMDGDFAKNILDTSRFLGNDFLKPSLQNPIENDKENFFISSGNPSLKRYYQAIKYNGSYGMDCNACCLMYFLQSYGLIPPFMNRKQFEYAFTPLYPNFKKHIKVDEIEVYTKDKSIKLVGEDSIFSPISSPDKYVLPVNSKILDGVFPNTEFFCRGRKGGGAIFPTTSEGAKQLLTFCDKFYDLSKEKGYEFMQEFRKSSYFNLSYMGLKNKYEDLVNGITDKKYFENNVIFIGLYGRLPESTVLSLYHYCLIVNIPQSETINNIDFWAYPSDDPYYGTTRVYVPKDIKTNLAPFANNDKYKIIFPNSGIGV